MLLSEFFAHHLSAILECPEDKIKFIDADLRGITFTVDEIEYYVRTWNIDEKSIRCTLLKTVGDHGEEVCDFIIEDYPKIEWDIK